MKAQSLIYEYLHKESLIRKEIDDPKLDFGYLFTFPPGPKTTPMQVIQPKDKDYMVISQGIQIPSPYVKALNSMNQNRRNKFFLDLRKLLLLQNFLFKFDLQHFRYQISDQVFLDEDDMISKNEFFKLVRKIYNTAQYCHMVLDEHCMGKVEKKDLHQTEDVFDPSFYS